MDPDAPKPLTTAELADLDARYVPFPSFEDWPKHVPREELWRRDLERYEEASEGATDDDLEKARQVALRTAAFDTGAIEGLYPTDRGLTFTVATQAASWELEVVERDKDALALFEAQLEAFELVLDLVTERFPKITQTWVRRIHEVVTRPQETYTVITPVGPQEQALPKGAYKAKPNHVRTASGEVHAYAPVEQTQSEMQRLMDEMSTKEFSAAHPITQASYVHYALVAVHPFADGNGRVARAVASAFTYRSASVPLLVLAHHRDLYFAALADADKGDPEKFVDFISRVSRDAVEMVTERLKLAQAPQPEDVLAEFKALYLAQGDLTHQQLDALANDFTQWVGSAALEQVNGLPIPDGVNIEPVVGQGGDQHPPSGFRSVVSPGSRYVQITLRSYPPGPARVDITLNVFVSTESDTATSVLLRAGKSGEELSFGLADLSPELSSTAKFRLENFLQRLLGQSLRTLLSRSRQKLEKKGY